MITRPFLLHALSRLYVGTGHAADVIDLPTARYKATGIPFKGVSRDARRAPATNRDQTEAVFSALRTTRSPTQEPLVVGDSRLLALRVRSFRGTFAWTTSPLLLTLAKRRNEEGRFDDLEEAPRHREHRVEQQIPERGAQ